MPPTALARAFTAMPTTESFPQPFAAPPLPPKPARMLMDTARAAADAAPPAPNECAAEKGAPGEKAHDPNEVGEDILAFLRELTVSFTALAPFIVCAPFKEEACVMPILIAMTLVCPATMALHLLTSVSMLETDDPRNSDIRRLTDTYHFVANILLTGSISGNIIATSVIAALNLYPIILVWAPATRDFPRRGRVMALSYFVTSLSFLVHPNAEHATESAMAALAVVAGASLANASRGHLGGWGDVGTHAFAAMYIHFAAKGTAERCAR